MAKVVGAIVNQAINEFMRPLVEKVPIPALRIMKKVGFDKILPIISVVFTALFPREKYSWGESLNDFTTEITAELRRIINEKVGEEEGGEYTTVESKKTPNNLKALNRIFLTPQLVGEINNLLTAFSELFEDSAGKKKSAKEIKKIMAMLADMGPENLYVFLKQDKPTREMYLGLFVKKVEEKSLEESIKDLKTELAKLREGGGVACQELVKPVFDKITPALKWLGDACKPGTEIEIKTTAFEKRAKKFRDTQKALRRK